MRYISLGVALFCFWLVLSGHYTVFLMTLGALSAAAVVGVGSRLSVVDKQGHPIHLLGRAMTYWPWLIKEIAKAAWDVTKLILNPKLPISPTMIEVKTSQRTQMGRNIYANSITLTPGTISVEVQRNKILVHAITQAGAKDLAEGAMDRRVKRFEGAR